MNVLVLVNVHVLVNGVNIIVDHEKLDVYEILIECILIPLNSADTSFVHEYVHVHEHEKIKS